MHRRDEIGPFGWPSKILKSWKWHLLLPSKETPICNISIFHICDFVNKSAHVSGAHHQSTQCTKLASWPVGFLTICSDTQDWGSEVVFLHCVGFAKRVVIFLAHLGSAGRKSGTIRFPCWYSRLSTCYDRVLVTNLLAKNMRSSMQTVRKRRIPKWIFAIYRQHMAQQFCSEGVALSISDFPLLGNFWFRLGVHRDGDSFSLWEVLLDFPEMCEICLPDILLCL